MRLRIIGFVLFAAAGCKGSGSTVSGLLVSTSSQAVPTSPTPAITVLGRSADQFSVSFDDKTFGGTSVSFTIDGLPAQEAVVLQVAQTNLDTISSFPFTKGGAYALELAAVPAGTMDAIRSSAVQQHFISGTSNSNPIVMGQIDPKGTGTCKSVRSLQLLNASDGTPASADGPFFFDSNGALVQGQFSDPECTYIYFNVLPGSYVIQFVGASLNIVGQHDVLAVTGQVSFGIDIP